MFSLNVYVQGVSATYTLLSRVAYLPTQGHALLGSQNKIKMGIRKKESVFITLL